MLQRYLTTNEIAEHCSVTQRTVIQWINDGKMEVYRTPGNHVRVKKEDFVAFLEKYNMPIPKELNINNKSNRVLIVDDDKNMAYSIKRVLKIARSDFEIDIALDGFDAGRKILLFEPSLVILDIRMPGLSGYDVAKKIKSSPEGESVKIIAISAFFDQDGKERIKGLGADECLDKPFNQQELLQVIEKLMGSKENE